jgi:hypothetical protein
MPAAPVTVTVVAAAPVTVTVVAAAPKVKRKAAQGNLIFNAFVKHMKVTRPEAFLGITNEGDRRSIVKAIRAENMNLYNTFVTEWKAAHPIIV